ncbi:hypothetical protein Tco_1169165, partial [Tanacetum coccineum]
PQRHVAGENLPQRHVAGENLPQRHVVGERVKMSPGKTSNVVVIDEDGKISPSEFPPSQFRSLDEDLVHYALDGLPEKYNQVCGYMHYQNTFSDFKTARSLLITEDMRLKSKASASLVDSSSPMVLLADSGISRRSSSEQVKSWRPYFNFAKDNSTSDTNTSPKVGNMPIIHPSAFYASPNYGGAIYYPNVQPTSPMSMLGPPPGFGYNLAQQHVTPTHLQPTST